MAGDGNVLYLHDDGHDYVTQLCAFIKPPSGLLNRVDSRVYRSDLSTPDYIRDIWNLSTCTVHFAFFFSELFVHIFYSHYYEAVWFFCG